jgi:hypothetical protein
VRRFIGGRLLTRPVSSRWIGLQLPRHCNFGCDKALIIFDLSSMITRDKERRQEYCRPAKRNVILMVPGVAGSAISL